jgi:hypothetical protein
MLYFSSYAFTYSLKNIHVHHHGGNWTQNDPIQHRKKEKECSIANIILQATFLFLFFQSNVVFHISIVPLIMQKKTTIKEFLK